MVNNEQVLGQVDFNVSGSGSFKVKVVDQGTGNPVLIVETLSEDLSDKENRFTVTSVATDTTSLTSLLQLLSNAISHDYVTQ